MAKIYDQAKDVNVAANLAYVKNGDVYAYSDSANTKKISAACLKDMFEKGVIIVAGAIEYKPVSFGIAGAVGTLTYVKANDTTPTTAVLATLVSSEYVAG